MINGQVVIGSKLLFVIALLGDHSKNGEDGVLGSLT